MCLLATYNFKEKNFFGIFKDSALEPDPDPHQKCHGSPTMAPMVREDFDILQIKTASILRFKTFRNQQDLDKITNLNPIN
jgi:hypothetical protein